MLGEFEIPCLPYGLRHLVRRRCVRFGILVRLTVGCLNLNGVESQTARTEHPPVEVHIDHVGALVLGYLLHTYDGTQHG